MIRPVDNNQWKTPVFVFNKDSLWYSKSGVFKRSADGKFIPQKRLYQPPTLFGAAAAVVLRTNQEDSFAKKLIESSDEHFTCESYIADCWHNTPCSCKSTKRRHTCPANLVLRHKRLSAGGHFLNVYVFPETKFFYVPK